MSDEIYRPPMLPKEFTIAAGEYDGDEYEAQKFTKGEKLLHVAIKDQQGCIVGWAFFGNMNVNGIAKPVCFNVHVDKDKRHQKLCTSMYLFVEHLMEVRIVRSPLTFPDGDKFWAYFDQHPERWTEPQGG